MASNKRVRLIEKTVQQTCESELMENKVPGPTIFILSNSIYYVSDNVLRLTQPGDIIVGLGHRVHARTTDFDLEHLKYAASRLDVGNYALDEHVGNTGDRYIHDSRTLLDFSVYTAYNRKLTLTHLEDQHNT